MALFSRFNPVPQFPSYKGPYNVGSLELEIPASMLSDTPRPSSAASISTVQFRLFYPTSRKEHVPEAADGEPAEDRNAEMENEAERAHGATGWIANWLKRHPPLRQSSPEAARASEAASKPVYWLPEPHQREYLSGYVRFLGARSGLAELISYIPRMLYHIALPAIASAPLLPTESQFRFPTMIFSHGLGGTRLAYSHLCGSIASHGVVVVVPEHRDGSCPVTFIKESSNASRVQVDYTPYEHIISEAVADGRNRQLEIRLWELSLIYAAVAKLDSGSIPAAATLFNDSGCANRDTLLAAFQNKLDINRPGSLIWAGHSFGASTTIQFLKSVYYNREPIDQPLFVPDSPGPSAQLPLAKQITPDSPTLLLDIWCLPTLTQRTHPLFKLSLPQVHAGKPRNVLVIMSDEFFRWRENLRCVKRLLSTNPGRRRGTEEHKNFELWDDDQPHEVDIFHPKHDVLTPLKEDGNGTQIIPPLQAEVEEELAGQKGALNACEPGPRFMYIKESAHLSQSDFGILFPRAVGKARGHEEVLDLNVAEVVAWLKEDLGLKSVLRGSEKGGEERVLVIGGEED